MRVRFKGPHGDVSYGRFVGLLQDERDDVLVVIRLDGYGLMLKAVHPSRVEEVEDEDDKSTGQSAASVHGPTGG